MAKPMTKTQLVAALAEEMGSDKKSAGAALDAVVNVITREVSNGGAVPLPGVGKIYCRERPERMVRTRRRDGRAAFLPAIGTTPRMRVVQKQTSPVSGSAIGKAPCL